MDKKFTTLIAEDDQISFELYKACLQDFDLDIIHAINGKVAVDIVKENADIDLILMDIRMPVLDGYEATKQIREIDSVVPIVAQTAFAVIPEQKEMLKMGFTDFFAKPLGNEVLSGIVNKYMDIDL